ncbi:hypothetical protein ACLBXM_20035 [Xanthobacteraceae bacterium A53D]
MDEINLAKTQAEILAARIVLKHLKEADTMQSFSEVKRAAHEAALDELSTTEAEAISTDRMRFFAEEAIDRMLTLRVVRELSNCRRDG